MSLLDIRDAAVRLRGTAVLDGVSLHVERGEFVSILGPSGAGKSALLLAIAGLLPGYGTLRIDGVPLGQSNADDWRAALALIPQKPHFRDVSLREELTSGRPAAPGAIADALRLADAQGIVARLPEGLETRLGESGAGVSGGEARRLTIARAALRRQEPGRGRGRVCGGGAARAHPSTSPRSLAPACAWRGSR